MINPTLHLTPPRPTLTLAILPVWTRKINRELPYLCLQKCVLQFPEGEKTNSAKIK